MRNILLVAAVFSAIGFLATPACRASTVQASWITRYGNESIKTADLSTSPRMLTNIQNSLMTAAPSVLNGATYLQRRTNFTDNYQQFDGIGETAQEWLRPDRISLSGPAVVVAAVPEANYPGAGNLLTDLGWTPLGTTITIAYYNNPKSLDLYAGLVDAGNVSISGAGIDQLVTNDSPQYFFFKMPPLSLRKPWHNCTPSACRNLPAFYWGRLHPSDWLVCDSREAGEIGDC